MKPQKIYVTVAIGIRKNAQSVNVPGFIKTLTRAWKSTGRDYSGTGESRMSPIDCVISGAQTGADQGGLYAAKELGLNTGGYMPKGWRTEDGPRPDLGAMFDMMEHESRDYEDRTKDNVRLGDATVIFGRRSRGSNLTERLCMDMGKSFMWLWWTQAEDLSPTPSALRLWLIRNKVKVLNVAGNRESQNPGIFKFTHSYLKRVLK